MLDFEFPQILCKLLSLMPVLIFPVFLMPTEVNKIQFKRMYHLTKVAVRRCVKQFSNDLFMSGTNRNW